MRILSGLDDIQALLDDHLIKALSMRGSAFVKPVEGKCVFQHPTLCFYTELGDTVFGFIVCE